jgi:hypothetical protein
MDGNVFTLRFGPKGEPVPSLGIEVHKNQWQNTGGAYSETTMVHVGSKTQLTGDRRVQLTVHNKVREAKLIREAPRTRTINTPTGESVQLSEMVEVLTEAKMIFPTGKAPFFGVSADWTTRVPKHIKAEEWRDNMPTEAYVLVILRHQVDSIKAENDAELVTQGFFERNGAIAGHVVLGRIPLGSKIVVTRGRPNAVGAQYDVTWDAVQLNIAGPHTPA